MDAGLINDLITEYGLTVSVIILFIVLTRKSLQVVSQSEEYVIERFGRYSQTLNAGFNFIVPFIDRVAHRVSILERQLDSFTISVITRDNVEIKLETSVFFRVLDASKSVYRIRDIDGAIQTTAESIIRSAAGKLELDEIQSAREQMAEEILRNLKGAAEIWGIEITRTEVTDVLVDDETKNSQRQQLNAERERRATVAKAEGLKKSVELAAEAKLYEATKEAEAVRIAAEAKAYAITTEAKATAEQTRVIAEAINNGGEKAISFDVLKKQVEAMGVVGSSDNAKTIVMPTDITKSLGSLTAALDMIKQPGTN